MQSSRTGGRAAERQRTHAVSGHPARHRTLSSHVSAHTEGAAEARASQCCGTGKNRTRRETPPPRCVVAPLVVRGTCSAHSFKTPQVNPALRQGELQFTYYYTSRRVEARKPASTARDANAKEACWERTGHDAEHVARVGRQVAEGVVGGVGVAGVGEQACSRDRDGRRRKSK